MKKVFLSFLSFLYIGFSFAQNIKIESCFVFTDEDYVQVATIAFPDNLATLDTAVIMWENERLILPRFYDEIRSEKDYGVVFKNDEYCIMISVFGDDVVGSFQSPTNRYSIRTDDSHISHLYELDANTRSHSEDDFGDINPTIEDYQDLRANNDSVIRIIVLYASSVSSFFKSNVYNTINQAILSANVGFSRSNITAKIELAYLGETDYDCENFVTDLNRFMWKKDSYMNDVHNLRNDYYADVCVLITSSSELCGRAATIKADESSAFVAVSEDFACIYDHTIDHEIGHLIGCRHDRYVDNNNIPYKYGHGFYHLDGYFSWRTIMAYDDVCDDNYGTSCIPIDNWSNPEIPHLNVPTGDSVYCNNARVWNERWPTVANFRSTPTVQSISGLNILATEYAHIPAKSSISVSGMYTIFPNTTCVFEAGDEIRLSSGFMALSGCNVQINIRPEASSYAPAQSRDKEHSLIQEEKPTASNDVVQDGFAIFPNPATDRVTISSSEPIAQTMLYNLNGQLVLQTSETQIDVSSLSSGVYIVHAQTSNGQILTAKFVHL